MSIIDRVTSQQTGKARGIVSGADSGAPSAKPVKQTRLPPAKARAKARRERATVEDMDAWERDRDGATYGAPDVPDPEVDAYGALFRPTPASAPADGPAAKAEPAPSAAPPKKARAKPVAEIEPHSSRSREFSFDHGRLEKFGFITPNVRRSRISEEFRLIKRRLMQRMSLSAKKKREQDPKQGTRNHVILVTSARPSEGKSFVAMNLALSIIFDEGLNVMLVDGDVARPSMSKILGLRNDLPGLTDLLLDDTADLPDVLLREHEHPLTYLAAGAMVPSATDLFAGERMETLVADMAERYADRIIIFDGPPLLASTEPVALAEHVGQVVMVVDAEKTSRSAVDSALDLLVTDQNVNLVLNKTTVGNRTEQFGSYYEAYNQAQP